MANAFGATVLIAIVLGYLFPYTAISMSEYGFVFLFLLMFFSGFSVQWGRLATLARRPRPVVLGLSLVFLLIPFLQWALASLLIDNERLVAGVFFAALMPVAMVAPYFSEKAGGDSELAYAVMLVSTLLTPVLSPLLLYAVEGMELPIRIGPLMFSIGIFTLIPFLISAVAAKLFPAFGKRVVKHLGLLNAVTLGTLIFILFGSVVMKLNMNYVSHTVVLKLLLLGFIQDFGFYFLLLWVLKFFMDDVTAGTLALSAGMKNVAISAGVLLFYDPQSALPSALVFVAHGFYFAWAGHAVIRGKAQTS